MLDHLTENERLKISNSFRSDTLELILLPTEKCNFRCTYCYEDFSIGRMPASVVNGIKNLISRRAASLSALHISWFGGEPLLQPAIVLDILRHARDLCGPNVTSGSFTTNGSKLTIALVQELSDLNAARFQVSLDGDKDAHNTTRVAANGGGTFDLIWNNLMAMMASDIPFRMTLRVHVTPKNIPSVKSLMIRLKNTLLVDKRFKIFFHKISNLGGAGKDNVQNISPGEYAQALQELNSMLPGERPASSENELVENKYICYAAQPNSLLIRADGRIGKCTVAFQDPRNDLGRIHEDGTLQIDRRRLGIWMEPFRTLDWKLLACPNSRLNELERQYDARNPRLIPAAVVTQ